MKKRTWLAAGGAVVLGTALAWIAPTYAPTSHPGLSADRSIRVQDSPVVTLYKSPTCACCAEWAEHMRANGFRVDVKDGANLAEVREDLGVPFRLSSCHTAVVGGYVLEGHVPADVVHELLTERPKITGLAVPGMPPGVPGMPDAGPNRKPYDVLAFDEDGGTSVYATR